MKRKFILLPITLTALAPAISLVGCGDPDTPEPPGPEYEGVEFFLEDGCFCTHPYQKTYEIKSYHLIIKSFTSASQKDYGYLNVCDEKYHSISVNGKVDQVNVGGGKWTDFDDDLTFGGQIYVNNLTQPCDIDIFITFNEKYENYCLYFE